MIEVQKDEFSFALPEGNELYYPITHEGRYSFYGLPVHVFSNSDGIGEFLCYFLGDHGPDIVTTRPIMINMFVHDKPAGDKRTKPKAEYFLENKYIQIYGSTIGICEGDISKITIFISYDDLENEYWFVRHFMRRLLMYLVYRRMDVCAFHASAISFNNKAILLLGPRGAGKSTIALHCLRRGFHYLSDDLVIRHLSVRDNTIWGEPWITFIRSDELRMYPEFQMTSSPHTKALVPLWEFYPNSLKRSAELVGCFCLERTDGPSKLQSISKEEILSLVQRELTVLKQKNEAHFVQRAIQHTAALFDRLPTMKLLNGTNLMHTVDCIQAFIKGK
jgi:hypothetical protein